LELKLRAGNGTEADKKELTYLVNKMNNNSVKPLIDAGLYTAISEDLSNEDLHKEGYIDDLVSKYTDKAPKGLMDTLNALYIAKNTPAFKALLMTMQQSDFAARYSTYYKLINQGVSKEKH